MECCVHVAELGRFTRTTNIGGDLNPGGAGVWELPGPGQSKPVIGKRYVPE